MKEQWKLRKYAGNGGWKKRGEGGRGREAEMEGIISHNLHTHMHTYVATTHTHMHTSLLAIELYNYDVYVHVADTGRKRTLFHCKWANSISYISRMIY